MLIIDWSSDVCSSDLLKAGAAFDFEDASTAGQVSVTVTATDRDGAGLSIDQGFSFAITDVNDYREATATGEALNGQEPRGGLGGRDILKGLAGDNVIHGLGGNDDLYGGADHDTLYGDAAIGRASCRERVCP